MSQLTCAIQHTPRRTRLTVAAVLIAVAALMLVWFGRATAEAGDQSSTALPPPSVSNVPTTRTDAVDVNSLVCTAGTVFHDMPGMTKTFRLGGRVSQPVIVLFQSEWLHFAEATTVFIQLTIDGEPASTTLRVNHRPFGEDDQFGTHGFNFYTAPLSPGMHTAAIQWREDGFGPGCAGHRSLIILHK